MSGESELTLPGSRTSGDQTEAHICSHQCLEAGAQAVSEPHQHQAHRPAWVSPPWLYLRSGPPSYSGGHLQLLPGSSCCSTGKQGSWPVPLATFHRGPQQSVRCPRRRCLTIHARGCDASSQLLTARPCRPCPCRQQEHGADANLQSHPFLYQIGMPRRGCLV